MSSSSQDEPTAPSTERPYHPKRPHRKTRTGCTNCKARKVKCDEGRPACRSCVLRRATCTYPDRPNYSTSRKPSPVSSRLILPGETMNLEDIENDGLGVEVVARNTIPRYKSVSYHPIYYEELDLKLLWWYTAFAHYSIAFQAGQSPIIDDILKVKIPQHAFQNRFLMDSVMALSASHIQHTKKGIEPDKVLYYRARALRGYRQAIEEADPQTFPALLAGSLFTAVMSSQSFRQDDPKALFILDWLSVWRGIGLIIKMVSPTVLWESGMSPLFFRPPLDLDGGEHSIPSYLFLMVSSIRANDPEFKYKDIYHNALRYLGCLYSELRNTPSTLLELRVITWFTFLPEHFVQLAQSKKPRALVIMAHYLMFLRIIREVWWTKGISEQEIPAIDRCLGEEWSYLMKVPRQSLKVKDRTELVRLALDDPNYVPARLVQQLGWVDNAGLPLEFDSETRTWLKP